MPRMLRLLSLSSYLAIAAAACARPGASGTPAPSNGAPAAFLVVTPTEPREQTADQQVHQILNRLAFGPRPGDVARVRALGVDQWITQQLAPERIDDAATAALIASGYETYHADARELVSLGQATQQAIRERARRLAQQGDTTGKREVRSDARR